MKASAEKVLAVANGPKGVVIALLPIVFYAANLFRMITEINLPYLLILFLAGGAGYLLLLCRQLTKKDMMMVIAVAVLTILFAGVNFLVVGNVDLGSLVTEVLLFGIGCLLLFRGCSSRIGEVFFYSVALVYAVYWILGIDAKQVMTSSNNFISVILLLAVFFYYTALEREGSGKIDSVRKLLPAFVCVVLCGWARGRAGILACGCLLVGMLLLYCLQSPVSKRFFGWVKSAVAGGNIKQIILLMLGVLVLAIVVWALLYFRLLDFLLGKFLTRGFSNSARTEIWSDYLNHSLSSARNFLLGTPVEEVPEVMAFQGNIHNSFLHIHAEHGVFIFVVVMALLLWATIYYWKNGMYLHFLMLGALCIRAFFDKFISLQYGLPIMLYFMLYPLVGKQFLPAERQTEKRTGEPLSNGKKR